MESLISKLRILIARTYRAEKLYGTIRSEKAMRALSSSSVSEIANDLRAREWQHVHHELRMKLNDLLERGDSSILSSGIRRLYEEFSNRAELVSSLLVAKKSELLDGVKRDDFAFSANVSFELIKKKAELQASRAIAEEIASVINLHSIKSVSQLENQSSKPSSVNPVATSPVVDDESYSKSNVIELRRRVV